MFQLKGKLSDGRSISGILPGDEPGAALTIAAGKLPEGVTFASVTLKATAGAALKVTAPRKPKDAPATTDAAAPAAPATPAPKRKR